MSWRTPRENENEVSLGCYEFWISGKSVIPACFWPCSPQAESGLDPRLKHSGVTVLRPSIQPSLFSKETPMAPRFS